MSSAIRFGRAWAGETQRERKLNKFWVYIVGETLLILHLILPVQITAQSVLLTNHHQSAVAETRTKWIIDYGEETDDRPNVAPMQPLLVLVGQCFQCFCFV